MTVSSKFDAHVYVGSDYHSRFTPVPNRGIDDYLERMPKSGITRALLTPGGQLGEVEENYRTVCELVRQRPSTLFGLRRLNPRDPAVSDHIASAINTDGMSGFMLHPSWDTFVANSRIVYPVMEAIAALGVPVLVYSGDVPYSMPAQVADLAAAFPTVPVIMGHMGKTELYQHAADCAARVPNLYLETSGCNITNIIENAVKRIGSERVVFGTGWPSMSPRAEVAKLEILQLSDAQRADIYAGNLDRLIGKRDERQESTTRE